MATAVDPATAFGELLITTDFGRESDRGIAYAKNVATGYKDEFLGRCNGFFPRDSFN
jgi:hypothetical protein